MHHANLHRWGIASGLEVQQTGPDQLTIKEGLAMDLEGRLIPLASIGEQIGQPGKAFINAAQPNNLVDVPVVFPTSSVAEGSYHLTIELPHTGPGDLIEGRLVTEGQSQRIISTPLIRLQPIDGFRDQGRAIILATVGIAGWLVTTLSGSERRLAGVAVGEIEFKGGGEVDIGPAGPEVGEQVRGSISSLGTGGLKVKVPHATDRVLLQREGGGNFQELAVKADQLRVDSGNVLAEGNLITTSGNVGIGTPSPRGKLTVQVPTHINVVLDRTDSQDHMTLTVGSVGSGIHFGDSNRFFISADPYDDRNMTGVGNEVLTILPSGNVGIGTTNPKAGLHVSGDASNGIILIERSGKKLALNPNYGDDNEFAHISTYTESNMGLKLDTDEVTRLTITTGGNVGIGTTSPTARLHVNGNVVAAGSLTLNSLAGQEMALLNTFLGGTLILGNGTQRTAWLAGGSGGFLSLSNFAGQERVQLHGDIGDLILKDRDGNETARLRGDAGSLILRGRIISTDPNGLVVGDRMEVMGNMRVRGHLMKSSGGFRIDHPLDPDRKYLSHSFVESPEMKNVYDGGIVVDANGEANVELPAWFEALNNDFRYQLTPMGAPGPNLYIAEEIINNRFKIAGGTPGMKVSWQVTGVRHDAWANANRIASEEAKPTEERGYYLHPELYGAPENRRVMQ
jgi:hypothetical protein